MVERYNPSHENWGRIPMEPDATGCYVRYSDYAALERQIEELRAERDEVKRRLFPYADATEICGYSTTGIYLIGDRKSIKAAEKAFHYSAQIEEYRAAFNERIEVAEAENARLRALPLKDEVERPDFWAVHSKTGMHIGLWTDRADADEAMHEYEGGTIMPLFRSSILSRLRAGEQEGWRSIEEVPDNKLGPFLVTNNPKSLNAFNRPSHVWCVGSIHADGDGGFCAFDGYQKIHGLKLYMSVPIPASPSVSDGGNRNG